MSPKTAMILSAGLGTRMQHLTRNRPKPLVKFYGKPLIDHVISRLEETEVENIVVNVHYKAGMLEAHLAERRSPRILISDERQKLLDTGGGVAKALGLLGNEPFYVHNSDSVWIEGAGSSLKSLSDRWDPSTMDGLLLLASTTTSLGYDGTGDFAMSPNGHLRRRREREIVPYIFAGVSILDPQLFDGCSADSFSLNEIFDKAIEAGRLFGLRHEGIWMHIGTPETLQEAEAFDLNVV